MTSADVLFTIVGLICAGSALRAVTSRHLVHSALWLTISLGSLAGCYLILGAELVALAQLLVYVGAVIVLVLFALVVTRAPTQRDLDASSGLMQRAAAFVVSAATAALLSASLIVAFSGARIGRTGTVQLSRELFAEQVWPFELLSLLLLVALVSAFATYRLPGRSGR